VELSDTSYYGYVNDVRGERTIYMVERLFIYGAYGVEIWVHGPIFSSVDEAMAELDEIEVVGREVVDAPREMEVVEVHETGEPPAEEEPEPAPDPTEEAPPQGPEIDPDKVGMPCDDYCKSLDPIGLGLPGKTYPNCTCDCGPGNAYVGLDCVPCSEMCTGADTFLYEPYGMTCTCVCDDPQKIWSHYLARCVDGPDRTGLDCETYCAEMVSGGVGRPDKTFPDCSCDCPPGQCRAPGQDIPGLQLRLPSRAVVPRRCSAMCAMRIVVHRGGDASD
jgi:hypothetical protein